MNAKLTDTQLKKLSTAVTNKTGTTLSMNSKMFDESDLRYELLLTTRQKTWLRNTFNNNMSVDIKLFRAQIFKTIQSGGFSGSLLRKWAGPLMQVAVPLAKKHFSSIRNYSRYFSNWRRNLKKIKNTQLRNSNLNNFKQRN